MHPGLGPSQGRTEPSNVFTKRKILGCSRPPLFPRVHCHHHPLSLSTPMPPAWDLSKYHKGPQDYPLVPRGDYTMCPQNTKWLLVNSSLCNRQGKHSPNAVLQPQACPLHHRAAVALPSSHRSMNSTEACCTPEELCSAFPSVSGISQWSSC